MTVLLRKLTEKSVMGYGKYQDLRVRSVLNMGRGAYLVWSYFNLSNISFVDEILVEIKIPIEFYIKKPGKDIDMWEKYQNYLSENIKYGALDKIINGNKWKSRKKGVLKARIEREKLYYSKGSMANRNRGH